MWFGVWNIDRLRDQMHSAERADNQNSLDMQLKHSFGVPEIFLVPLMDWLTVLNPNPPFLFFFPLSLAYTHLSHMCLTQQAVISSSSNSNEIKTSKSHQTVNASRNRASSECCHRAVLPLSAWREQSDELWQGRGISCVNTGVAFPGSETWLVIKNWR